MASLRTTALLLFVLVGFGPVVLGQTATGEVNGTITDPNGGVMAGATATLINQATSIEVRTVANQSGYFTFVNVKPGRYLLQIESKGFKTTRTSTFDVGVSQTVTQNVSLTLGEVSEAVQVTATTDLVQRSSTELGTVIAERAVQDLPLNGRNFTQLLTLSPGVTPVSTSQNRSIGGVEGNVGIPGSAVRGMMGRRTDPSSISLTASSIRTYEDQHIS